MILIPILITICVFGVFWLKHDSDKIHEELLDFECRAMFKPKETIPQLRKELFDYKKCWHKYHYLKMNKIFAIVDARQKWEK